MTAAIDPGAARVLQLGAEAGGKAFEEGTPDEARRAYRASYLVLQGEKEPVAAIEARVIDGPRGPIPARLYRGTGAPERDAPALLYVHGGGWVIGDLDSHDDICRWFANLGQCVVLCPDYRLAPEHPFPTALDDCLAALRFLGAATEELGIDPARIAVAGDSAGGNLATVLALHHGRDGLPRLAAQLLIYPNTDARQGADSYRRYGEGYGLTARTMAWFRDHYLTTPEEAADWRVSPLLADNLAEAPPAFVALAGLDILHDEGDAYVERLRAAGVPLAVSRLPDQIHGFASAGRFIPQARELIVEAVAAWRRFEAYEQPPIE
ncbi:lipase [Aureimonas endophytica]|uniref:Lipase n=1 Tax=Aureimonas endophytica TaxID=2027858 RepID=A0A916ZWT7_9HYPH|nr:alpha/beta hydrolase [Aureimonas endophytica]GGE15354.1 lipase [Aureimonas endophytica]